MRAGTLDWVSSFSSEFLCNLWIRCCCEHCAWTCMRPRHEHVLMHVRADGDSSVSWRWHVCGCCTATASEHGERNLKRSLCVDEALRVDQFALGSQKSKQNAHPTRHRMASARRPRNAHELPVHLVSGCRGWTLKTRRNVVFFFLAKETARRRRLHTSQTKRFAKRREASHGR